MTGLFDVADVIHAYTRAQAIEDGDLTDISKLASEAGIKFPVACTCSVVEWLSPTEDEADDGQSWEGRTWDLVWMLSLAAQRSQGGSDIRFQVIFTRGRRQQKVNLKALCGPGDNAEPVITVMLPEED